MVTAATHAASMFERFTARARRVVVHAQEEARRLQHNYIGTEHLLLGLLREPDGVASVVLERLGLTLDDARHYVADQIGPGKKPAKTGHIPFTPRAKKVLELALREAIQLGHNYIGTEHLLLGLVREGDGVGAQILQQRCGGPDRVCQAVIRLLPEATPDKPGSRLPRWRHLPFTASQEGTAQRATEPHEPGSTADLRLTPAANTSLTEAAGLAGPGLVGSHHLLLAALADADTAAARALTAAGIDLDRATEALRSANVAGSSDEQPADRGRRNLRIRVTDEVVAVEAGDDEVLGLARAALDALGGEARDDGVIPGDSAAGAGLGPLWQALRDALVDIGRPGTPDDEPPEPGQEHPPPA